jgi:agmatinase
MSSNFLGTATPYADAEFVLFGAPFDSTASYRPGARFGCSAIRSEFYGLESYSPYQDKDLADTKIFDGGDLDLCIGDAAVALMQIEAYADTVLDAGKKPVLLGGEHLVTLGAVRALVKRYPDLHVLHFDAHADLRDEYLGAKLSHATVMRRVWELLGDGRIRQFGIRSGDRSEFVWGQGHVAAQRFNFEGLEDSVRGWKDTPVYVTLDLDVLDPSAFPGTGTPEAGGVSFMELLGAIRQISELNIVGFDMVELAPNLDPSGVSTAAACKLLREMLLAWAKR